MTLFMDKSTGIDMQKMTDRDAGLAFKGRQSNLNSQRLLIFSLNTTCFFSKPKKPKLSLIQIARLNIPWTKWESTLFNAPMDFTKPAHSSGTLWTSP